MDNNFYGSICLSDIPRSLIVKHVNGKKYLNISVRQRQQPDRYGNTHYIKVRAKKDELGEGVNPYIGNLKPSQPQQQAASESSLPAEQVAQAQQFMDDLEHEVDDLPF